jgi:hypothetical protein
MHQQKRFPAWQEILAGSDLPGAPRSPITGWDADPTYDQPIVEPRMHYAPSMPSVAGCKIVFVAAPGAVGKSALARYLADRYRHVLVDLSLTGPVGEHFVAGGLFRAFGSAVVEKVEAGQVGLIFDALDEARLRVTPESFDAFLNDIAALAKMATTKPVLLFGRTSTVEAAWLALSDLGVPSTIAEIGFFNRREAFRWIPRMPRLSPFLPTERPPSITVTRKRFRLRSRRSR